MTVSVEERRRTSMVAVPKDVRETEVVRQGKTMMAIVQDQYGSADVLKFQEINKPEIGDDDVLIRVSAAGVHIGDWHLMAGQPYAVRLGFGFRAPKARVRGIDVAGTVEATGKNVTQFHVGDDVFGTCDGSFAEYARAKEDQIVSKPANLTFEEAATLPISGFAALQALRDAGEIKAGQKVLIVGASGGVGTFAVQIAKSLGAEVTGVCSTSKVEMVRSLGADHVIDYTKEHFTDSGRQYDIVLDVGGSNSISRLRRAVRRNGTLVMVGGEGGNRWVGTTYRWVQALILSPFVSQKLRLLSSRPCKEDLNLIKELAEAGKLTPVIDRTYELREAPDAIRHLISGRARGKVVIRI